MKENWNDVLVRDWRGEYYYIGEEDNWCNCFSAEIPRYFELTNCFLDMEKQTEAERVENLRQLVQELNA